MVPFRCLLLVAGLGALAGPLSAEEPQSPQDKVSYYRDVRPILRLHCQGCHQPAKPLGGLVLTSFEAFKKGGESEEPGFVPGKPDDSSVVNQVTPVDGEAAMPKDKPPLADDEIALIKRWIAEGAEDDSPMSGRVAFDMQHPPGYALPPVLTSVDYSPDGQLIAVSGYHEVLLHKADGSGIAARLVGLSERIESAVFSPDGKRLAVTGGSPGRFGEVQIWDVEKRELLLSVNVGYDTLYGASWSHDGTRVAFGCPDKNVRAIDAETGQQVLQQGAHTDWPLDTVFSTDDSHLISVSRDRSAKLTEVATQRFVDNITSITPGALKGGLAAVDLRPGVEDPMKDQVVVGGADGVPKLYRIHREKKRVIGDDFNLIRAYPKMPGRVFALAFNREGTQIAAGSSYDDPQTGTRLGDVRVFNVEDGKQIAQFADQEGAVYALDFSPDGMTVATAGFDGWIRLYDPATGKQKTKFLSVPLAKELAAAGH